MVPQRATGCVQAAANRQKAERKNTGALTRPVAREALVGRERHPNQEKESGSCLLATTGHTQHTTTSMLYSTEGSGSGGEVEEVVHGSLFLYGQDLAPFRIFRWLPALQGACLSTPLYKNNPLWVKELVPQRYATEFYTCKFFFFRTLGLGSRTVARRG